MRLMARTEQGSATSTQASQHCDHRSAHGMMLIIVEVACDARRDGSKPGLGILSSRAPLDTYLNAKRVQTNCGMIMIGWTAQHCIVVATVASEMQTASLVYGPCSLRHGPTINRVLRIEILPNLDGGYARTNLRRISIYPSIGLRSSALFSCYRCLASDFCTRLRPSHLRSP